MRDLGVDTVVVGGGAAGMMAAVAVAESGRRAVLLEGNDKLGRKILISGNGRCNLTNTGAEDPNFYHGANPNFIKPALKAFDLTATLGFFDNLGVSVKEEKRGRLFPRSEQAQSIIDVLEERLRILGVDIELGSKVISLVWDGRFKVQTSGGRYYTTERVVLASGGISLSRVGADRSGIALAEGLGHKSTELLPGLVGLESADGWIKRMRGVRIRAVVSVSLSGSETINESDDLLFTPYGISGFSVLNLSARLMPFLSREPVEMRINFFPGLVGVEVCELLQERWFRNPQRTLLFSFSGLLHGKVVGPVLHKLGLDPSQKVHTVTPAQRWYLAKSLVGLPVVVDGPRSFENAEVTIGGIYVSEIDPNTLESRFIPGLYFAGEMVDVHGDLGGFNFQWAWSSGQLAGAGLGH